MSGKRQPKPAPSDDTPFQRFERFAKALFQVDKREVPKHEPKRRAAATNAKR
jgi:hypothetical protein